MAKKATSGKAKPRSVLSGTHTGHANHLCSLVARRQMSKVATLARDATYVCYICGRAARKPENLCEPVEI